HVVAADLRGYGDSSAPPEEPDSSNYSFRAMAQDQVEVMQALGYDRFYVAGHDRGGRTVHRMCLDHPEKVIKAAIIDIVLTLDMWRLRANDVRGEALPTGHYVNEEEPDQVLAWFLRFFEA